MPKKRDLTGKVFGRLKAKEPGFGKSAHTSWICDCDCGESVEVRTTDLLHSRKTSCGCEPEQDRTVRTCICCEREFYSHKKRREFCFDCCPDGLTPNQNWRVKQRAIKHQLLLYKGTTKCERCGYDAYEFILQFHHIDPKEKGFSTKDFNLNRTTHSMAVFKREVDKCIVVCANCHCEIHEELQDEITFKEIMVHELKKADYDNQQLVAPKNFETRSVVDGCCKICGQKYVSNNISRTMCYECSPEGLSHNASRRARGTAVKKFLVQYKGGCCERCGYHKSIHALQFHHKNPTEKEFTVSHIRTNDANFSMKLLIDEVDKCELLCANCHHIEHYIFEDATDVEFLNESEYKVPIPIQDLIKAREDVVEIKCEVKAPSENSCIVCGTILKRRNSHICQKCSHDNQRRVKDRPGKIQLSKMIIESGFEAIGRQYGVSGKAISKWLIAYKLPSKKKELEKWFYNFTGMAHGELK